MFTLKNLFSEEAGADGGAAGGAAGGEAGADGGAAGAAGGGEGTSWIDNLDEELRGVAANKGWKTEADAVRSYRDLERKFGANPDSVVKMPAMDADPKEWDEFYNKLGRPEDPKEYEIPLPEAGEPIKGFEDWARNAFHKHGITPQQAKGILGEYNQMLQQQVEESHNDFNTRQQAEVDELAKEWGVAHDKNVKIAAKGAQVMGITPDQADALEDVLGYGQTMRMMHNIGSKLGEDVYVDGQGGGGDGAMTPAQAMDEIGRLKLDKDFRTRLQGQDPVALKKWDQLHQMAYPSRRAG